MSYYAESMQQVFCGSWRPRWEDDLKDTLLGGAVWLDWTFGGTKSS